MALTDDTTLEGAVFAVFSFTLEQSQLDKIRPNVDVRITFPEGPNGTAFFISSTDFVTAHHVLNTKFMSSGMDVIANNAGYLYADFEIIREQPDTDTTVCRLKNQKHPHYLKLNQVEISTADILLSIGIERARHGSTAGLIRKANNSFTVAITSRIYFEKRQSTYVASEFVEVLYSTGDDPVTLIKTTILITEPRLSGGFSGGPTINVKTVEVVGMACMQVTTEDDSGGPPMFGTALIPVNCS
jgi:hypothetical protein